MATTPSTAVPVAQPAVPRESSLVFRYAASSPLRYAASS
eukprot:CAMPEP_0204276596 /NCGR_PEP_ID=MMETSP0468-20130131/28441_1 /ASSEMBLY_ACC=CAM_ASM_000383 /TAXON_ID=2969 /ORGANISM="Oxyrrhis marina" /LENGTH=38 /DNA_ID= /DNA_START= /DNA_END= /DNA_ORIENTATION=